MAHQPGPQADTTEAELLDYSRVDPTEITTSLMDLRTSTEMLHERCQEFTNKCMGLSRVTGLLLTVRIVMELLPDIYDAFHWNAVSLVPESYDPIPSPKEFQEKWIRLPSNLRKLADSLRQFRVRISEFKALAHEDLPLTGILSILEDNLTYRASCAREYETKLNTQTIRYYIHQFLPELKDDLLELANKVQEFSGDGISAIRHEQERSSRNFQVVLTVSTFFSSVTGGALQMAESTAEPARRELLDVTLALWFTSMVFSVGAALNSLLAIAWRGTILGSRGDQLPPWVKRWTEGLQFVFLGASIATFSVGLVTYTYSSSDHTSYTPPITLSFFGIIFVGVISVLVWMIGDTHTRVRQNDNNEKPRINRKTKLRDTLKAVRQMKSAVNAFASIRGLSNYGEHSELIPSINLKKYGIINDVAYSDDGKWLAVSCTNDLALSWTVIFDSQSNHNRFHRDIQHEDSTGPSRLSWSPLGTKLIVKFDCRLEIRDLEGNFLGMHERDDRIQDVAWYDDDTFLAACNSSVWILKVANAQVTAAARPHMFRGAQVLSIGLEKTSGHLIAIAEVATSHESIKPKRGRLEKRIIVIDMAQRLPICEVPTLDNIQSVRPIRGVSEIMMTRQNKDDMAFQMCTLKVGGGEGRGTALFKSQVIASQSNIEKFIGPAGVGGNSDQFLFCSLSSGAIGIWHALRPDVFYGCFAPEILQDKRLGALSWKRSHDGTPSLAAAVKSSDTLHIWRGKKVIWGVTDVCGDLVDAHQKITNKSLYFPAPATDKDSTTELQVAFQKITHESLYFPSTPLTTATRNGAEDLHDACQQIIANSLYFRTPNGLELLEPDALQNAYQRITIQSPYTFPSPALDSGTASGGIGDLFDAYQRIGEQSLYFYSQSSLSFIPNVPDELLDAYEKIRTHSAYFSPIPTSHPPHIPLEDASLDAVTNPVVVEY